MSLRQVKNPHMKNNVVTTASGPVVDDDESGETAAERLGGGIAIVRVSAGNHSIACRPCGFLSRGHWRANVSQSHLKFHQPVRRFGEDGERRQLAAHHGDLVAAVISGTDVTVFVDLV